MKDRESEELPAALRAALGRIEARAESAARSVDEHRLAEGVLAELRRPAVAAVRPAVWLRRAAAVALLLGGAAAALVMTRGGAPAVVRLPVNMDSLHPSDSQAIMIAVDEVHAAPDSALTPAMMTVDDLDEQELRALLQAMENEESL